MLFKFCKENHRGQSKSFDVSFSIEFSFETKIGCFVTRICTFAHSYFSTCNDTRSTVERAPHIHISSVILVISMILMNVFVSPYSFDNITVIVAHFHNIIFCFKFYYPIVDVVNQLYLIFLRSRETNTKCCDKNVKTHSDIVLV